ncbi:hypothetical protein KCU65_g216, partial [Aureobasidium melanogenum]
LNYLLKRHRPRWLDLQCLSVQHLLTIPKYWWGFFFYVRLLNVELRRSPSVEFSSIVTNREQIQSGRILSYQQMRKVWAECA